MKKIFFLIPFILFAGQFILLGQKLFTGNEWKVDSYQSIKNVVVKINFPPNTLVYEKNVKDKLVKLQGKEYIEFIQGSEYEVLEIEAIKKADYLPVRFNHKVYYLPLKKNTYLGYIQNWGVYEAIIRKMNMEYAYLKSSDFNNVFPYASSVGLVPVLGDAYKVEWLGYECKSLGSSSYEISFNVKINDNLKELKTNIHTLNASFFLTAKEVDSLKTIISLQNAMDSLEDLRVHAFMPVSKIYSPEIDTDGIIFMFAKDEGYVLGKSVKITSSYDLKKLVPVSLTEEYTYNDYEGFAEYLARRGDTGLDIRERIAKEADSIHTTKVLEDMEMQLTQLLENIEEIKKSYKQKKIFLIGKNTP